MILLDNAAVRKEGGMHPDLYGSSVSARGLLHQRKLELHVHEKAAGTRGRWFHFQNVSLIFLQSFFRRTKAGEDETFECLECIS